MSDSDIRGRQLPRRSLSLVRATGPRKRINLSESTHSIRPPNAIRDQPRSPYMPTITAFESSPDRGKGQARDMRVRWALEEVAAPYDVRLVSFATMKEPAHLALHPFGQIPTYEDGDLALFESGAIVLHIAERHAGLLPTDPHARARAIAWMFAALTTVQAPIVEREGFILMEKDKGWFEERLPILDDRVRTRLGELSRRLGDADWLDGEFSAGDLLMINVL